ncbi:MAG: sugar phosphate isomerase/epimerase family protein [Candidatus Humimicrobiaceae bacterium]
MKLNIDSHLWVLGSYNERYVPGGYFPDMDVDRKLDIISKIEGIKGLFVFYPSAPLPEDPYKLVKKLKDFNLVVSNLSMDNFTDKKWKYGAFASTSKKTRKENIKFCKESIDFAKIIGAHSVLLWPAHDGFDYPFQVNYKKEWGYLIESIKEIGEYDPQVKLAVEYKSKDPRQKLYISNVGKVMSLLSDVNLDNVGAALDTGHALMANENLSESLAVIDAHKKLFQVHLNENYKDADPDLILGTINFWEILEFFYSLHKTDFNGWATIDMISSRGDRIKALQLAAKMVLKYDYFAKKLLEHRSEIEKNLDEYNFSENMDIISDLIFK